MQDANKSTAVLDAACQNLKLWQQKITDPALLAELDRLAQNDDALKAAFGGELEFGTAGMRAPMGAGTNYLNIYTVAKATRGAARHLKNCGFAQCPVAISYDSRINSRLFAQTTASVFADEGFTVHLTKSLMPTPFLSYLVRELDCCAGVMITASHNSSEYNGYKLYDATGTQINEATAKSVLAEIAKTDLFALPAATFRTFLRRGKIIYTASEIERRYFNVILSNSLEDLSNIRVAYSALNGTGYRLIPRVLRACKLKKLTLVREQCRPDGHFPTCPSPNPEKIETLALGLEQAKQAAADILIATDPDCDRVGVAVLHKGEYIHLSGHQTGALLCGFLLKTRAANGTLPKTPVVIKSIVTSGLIERITTSYGGQTVDLLTGFKYIGEHMCRLQSEGRGGDFVLGLEESCGYLSAMHVRDKDGVLASMQIAQMCARAAREGKTLIDVLEELYARFGYFGHNQVTYRFAGLDGQAQMSRAVDKFRTGKFPAFGGIKVTQTADLAKTGIGGVKSNVVIFDLEGGSQVIVRPSGTEPLVKVYLSACGEKAACEQFFTAATKQLGEILQA